MLRNKPKPNHPGTILKEMFLEPLKISAYRVSKSTGIPQSRLSEIIAGRRSITADTALRLGKFFSCDPLFWLDVQNTWDLSQVPSEEMDKIEQIRPYHAADS